jgi:flagellar hook assembly protein FlgD
VRALVYEPKDAGYHRMVWDGRDDLGNGVASGIYLYRIDVTTQNPQSKSFSAVRKLTIVR